MKILIDNGHGRETAGKRSPDGRLLEWAYNREIARRVVTSLLSLGNDAERLVPEDEDISLAERCRRVNRVCSELGRRNVCMVSIHVNAAGRGNRWYEAEGWCCYTTPGQTQGDILANHLCQAALQNLSGHRMRFDYTDSDAEAYLALISLQISQKNFPLYGSWVSNNIGESTIAKKMLHIAVCRILINLYPRLLIVFRTIQRNGFLGYFLVR